MNDMTGFEEIYLTMVVIAFAAFATTLKTHQLRNMNK
jgi:hypothetical protein